MCSELSKPSPCRNTSIWQNLPESSNSRVGRVLGYGETKVLGSALPKPYYWPQKGALLWF